MKKIFDHVAAITAAGFLCAASLGAGAEGMPGSSSSDVKLTPEERQAYSQLDTNSDGKISEKEAKQNPDLAARFTELDKNNNNMIEEGEFARFEVETEQEK